MKFFAAVVLMALPYLALGQSNEIKWGKQEKAGGTTASYMPLGWSNGQFYTIQMEKKDGRILTLDELLNLKTPQPMVTGQKRFEADVMYMQDDQIYLLTSEFEGKDKKNYVRAASFSKNGKPGNVKWKRIATVNVERNGERSDFQYFFSQDSSKILMLHVHDVKRKDRAKISINVVEAAGFKEVWKATTEMPYNHEDMQLLTSTVANNGDVMLVATVKGEEGKRLEQFSTNIFSFNTQNKNFEEEKMKLDDKFLSSARISYTQDGKGVITGFYNSLKNGSNKGLTGAFIADFDPSRLREINIKTFDMDGKTLASITPYGILASMFSADQLNAYSIEEFSFNPDGSGYVVAEQRYIRESSSDKSVTRRYYFNHLIVYRFDSKNNIQWISTIPKQQVSAISTPKIGVGPFSFWYFPQSLTRLAFKYNSFTSMEKDNKIYIIYNDHKSNGNAQTLRETKSMSNKNTALATLVTMDNKGKWKKDALFRGKDLGVILETSSSYRNGNQGFLISAEKKSALQFGLLDL